ncbi:MAG: GTP-binding protein, partial [Dehalococcoidia bacterium]|nr:GTP-binding protein [Dehalococcoidia bacterium]
MSVLDLFPSREAGPFGRRLTRERGSRIPVTVVTGFLGAGKTTLVQRFLASPEGRGTAVIVNEFGEVGIDDALVRASADETVLLGNGCVCCATRSDLQVALRRLVAERDRGSIPPFRRIVIETSGLADPGPILQTFSTDRALGNEFHAEVMLAVVDAPNGAVNLDRAAEARRQVILADRLVEVGVEGLPLSGDLLHAAGLQGRLELALDLADALDPLQAGELHVQAGQRALQFALHGPTARLEPEAVEISPVVVEPERARVRSLPPAQDRQAPLALVYAAHDRRRSFAFDHLQHRLLEPFGVRRKKIVRQVRDAAPIGVVERLHQGRVSRLLVDLPEKGEHRWFQPRCLREGDANVAIHGPREDAAVARLRIVPAQTPGVDVEAEGLSQAGMTREGVGEEARIDPRVGGQQHRQPLRGERRVAGKTLLARHAVHGGRLLDHGVKRRVHLGAVLRPTQHRLDRGKGDLRARVVGVDAVAVLEGMTQDPILDVAADVGRGRLRVLQSVCFRLAAQEGDQTPVAFDLRADRIIGERQLPRLLAGVVPGGDVAGMGRALVHHAFFPEVMGGV